MGNGFMGNIPERQTRSVQITRRCRLYRRRPSLKKTNDRGGTHKGGDWRIVWLLGLMAGAATADEVENSPETFRGARKQSVRGRGQGS